MTLVIEEGGKMRKSAFLTSMLGVASAVALFAAGVSLPGSGPGEVLASEGAQDRLYVTAQDKLLVVDPASLRIVKTVNVGGSLAAAAATADGRLLYAANSALEAVMVIDTATSQVIDLVRVGINPVGPVLLGPDEKTVWVISEEAVSVIDAAAHKLVATIPVNNGVSSGLAFAPSGSSWRAYVSNPKDNTVIAIDAQNYAVVARIPVGKAPWRGVVYSQLTGKVYVANTGSQDLSVIDVLTNKVVNTILLPRPGFNNIAITKDGRFLFLDSRYSRNGGDSQIVVDATTESVVATIDIRPTGTSSPANPSRLVFTPDGRLGISIHKTSPNVTVVDVAALKVLKTIELKPLSEKVLYRCSVTLSPDGGTAYVTSAVEETITVIDVPTLTVRAIVLTHAPTCGMYYVRRR
jgi:YVTN family beta-propeller protein